MKFLLPDVSALRGTWPFRFPSQFLLGMALAFFLTVTPASARERVILAFGDSLTAGYGLKPGEAYPAQLQKLLRAEGLQVRVVNAGVSGDTTTEGRARLDWVLGGLKEAPDLVIVALGANDMLRGQKPVLTRANLDAMLKTLSGKRVPMLLAGMRAAPNLGPVYRQEFDGIYPDLSGKYRVPLYSFLLEGVVARPAFLLADGMHPNAAGARIIAANILPHVRRALK